METISKGLTESLSNTGTKIVTTFASILVIINLNEYLYKM